MAMRSCTASLKAYGAGPQRLCYGRPSSTSGEEVAGMRSILLDLPWA